MSVQGPNAVVKSHSKAAPACQTSVPPGSKKPSIVLLNELWLLESGNLVIWSA